MLINIMRVHLLSFLLFIVAAAQEFADEVNEDLFIYDDDENLVRLDLTESVPIIPPEDMKEERGNAVKFYLNTRDSLLDHELFVDDEETLKKSSFDINRETKFVTHGWVSSKKGKACTLVKDGFLKRGDFNVIVVDWDSISHRPYPNAVSNVKNVGQSVAKMIDFLANNGMNLNTTTLIGHSLGAHVAGLAGYYSKGKVNIVVGLDPARPGFNFKKPGDRISAEDANYVEIIHTNAGKIGLLDPIGTADFYPNGGTKQLGCIADLGGSCSHARSYQLYAESLVSKNGFYGKQCSIAGKIGPEVCNGKFGKMGGHKRCLRYDGSYYVPTNDKAPFAVGKLLP